MLLGLERISRHPIGFVNRKSYDVLCSWPSSPFSEFYLKDSKMAGGGWTTTCIILYFYTCDTQRAARTVGLINVDGKAHNRSGVSPDKQASITFMSKFATLLSPTTRQQFTFSPPPRTWMSWSYSSLPGLDRRVRHVAYEPCLFHSTFGFFFYVMTIVPTLQL